ncbi:MAG TPA: cell division protein ZipA [Thiotrichales bacterium]|nr:cell division protein ZipA [Thiotrichales bacterium]
MDSLRWILLLLGVLVVAGVYLYSRFGGRAAGRRKARLADPEFEAPSLDIREEGPSLSLDDLEAVAGDDTEPLLEPAGEAPAAAAESAAEPEPEPAPAAEGAAEEKIVTLYLVAPRGQPFAGPRLLETFEDLGLAYGEMSIYHRLSDDALERPVFSVANLVEPGTLTPEELLAMNTPGLAIFLRLPGPVEPLAAFDDMLEVARGLAARLRGELRDQDRAPLDEAAALRLRGEVAAWAETHPGRFPA